MPVATMGRRDQVVLLDHRHRTDRHGFLAGVEVRGPLDLVLPKQIINLIFEPADSPHLLQQFKGFFLVHIQHFVPVHRRSLSLSLFPKEPIRT